jgi:hypothetical protein
MFFNNDFDRQEAFKYRPGQRVELKSSPNTFDIIADYDPMMVPPISLVNDPKLRYPEELTIVHRPLISLTRPQKTTSPIAAQYPACRLRDRQVASKTANLSLV